MVDGIVGAGVGPIAGATMTGELGPDNGPFNDVGALTGVAFEGASTGDEIDAGTMTEVGAVVVKNGTCIGRETSTGTLTGKFGIIMFCGSSIELDGLLIGVPISVGAGALGVHLGTIVCFASNSVGTAVAGDLDAIKGVDSGIWMLDTGTAAGTDSWFCAATDMMVKLSNE